MYILFSAHIVLTLFV